MRSSKPTEIMPAAPPAARAEAATFAPIRARSVSIVVPVYNSATTLPHLVERLEPVLRAHADAYELILVNDGSRDESWEVASAICRDRPWVRGIELLRNYGEHNALLCGIRAASHPIVVTIDDDLQHPPEEIPKLLAALEGGHDVAYGTPRRERHGLCRGLTARATKRALAQTMGVPLARHVSAFRAFRTALRDAFASYEGFDVSIDALLAWGTTRCVVVTVEHAPRHGGISNYTFRKLVTHAMNMITGFSTVPLQIASLVGFASTLLGILLLGYVIGRYLIQGSSAPIVPLLASVIAIFSGAQLLALGIIGEYLARMHFRTMSRPPYAVRSTTAPAESTTDGSKASPRV